MAAPITAVGSKPEKIWRDAVMRAVKRKVEGGKSPWLERLADRLVEAADKRDIQALKEIGDRLDGKPVSQVNVAGNEGGPLVIRWQE